MTPDMALPVRVAVGQESGFEVVGDVARAPPAEPVLGVRRDVGHLLAVRSVLVPGQLARRVPGAEQVARRVAFPAVAQVLVKHHGEDSANEAAIRVDAMLEKGDLACPECRFLARGDLRAFPSPNRLSRQSSLVSHRRETVDGASACCHSCRRGGRLFPIDAYGRGRDAWMTEGPTRRIH